MTSTISRRPNVIPLGIKFADSVLFWRNTAPGQLLFAIYNNVATESRGNFANCICAPLLRM